MTRILHIVPQFTTGGAEKMVLYYTQMLAERGFDVIAACAVETGELEAQFLQKKLNTFVCSRRLHGGRIGTYLRLLRFVRTYKPDVVHTHLFGGDLLGFLIRVCVYRRARWVSTLHNVEHATSMIRKIVWFFLLRGADAVITVSPVVDAYTARVFRVPQRRRHMILNGIPLTSLQEIQPITQVVDCVGVVQMATIGRLTIQKGHRYLFEALSLFPKHISWQLHVYGDGELRNDLHVLAVRYGIDTHVVFHGVVSDVSQVLRSISIIVQPSLWEGLSLVVMEAMAAGRSIVTTDAGGSGIVIDGESGFVVPSRDAQTLVSALTMACTDVSRSVQYAHAAKTFALQALDIEGNMEKVIQVYRVI